MNEKMKDDSAYSHSFSDSSEIIEEPVVILNNSDFLLSPKAISQQIETVREIETVRDKTGEQSPSARFGLQRKSLRNSSISNSITDSLQEYDSDIDNSSFGDQKTI